MFKHLFSRSVEIIERIQLALQKPFGFLQKRARWVRLIIQGVIIVVCVGYLALNFRQLQQYQAIIHFRFDYLFYSWGLTFIALWLGALGWGLVLRSMGLPVPWGPVAGAHLSSNLAKYLPGYGWQLVGKAYLMRQLGVSTKRVSLAILCEFSILILSGAGLAAIVTILYPVVAFGTLRLFVVIGGVAALGLLGGLPVILPLVGRRIWNLESRISLSLFWTTVVVDTTGWILFGISFWFLGAALVPVSLMLLPHFLFAIVGSFLVSLAVLVIPGGIGVRESVMVFLLGAVVGDTPATLIAISSRLVWLLSELAAFFMARIVARKNTYHFKD